MKKITKNLLKAHDSYIDAMEAAIQSWKEADNESDKRDYILTIGEIGQEIHRMNKALNISSMNVA